MGVLLLCQTVETKGQLNSDRSFRVYYSTFSIVRRYKNVSVCQLGSDETTGPEDELTNIVISRTSTGYSALESVNRSRGGDCRKKPVESPRMKTGSFVIRHAIYRRFFSHLCRVALTGFCARYVRRTVRPSWLVPHFRPIWRSGRKYNIPVVIKLKISAPASFFSRRSGIYRFPSKRSSILDFFRSYPLANNVFLIMILKSHFSLPEKK